MITDNELSRLSDMTQALRPEWPARTTRAFLANRMRNRTYLDLGLALAAVALDPTSTSPARVEQPGPWWQTAKATGGTPMPGPGDEPACPRAGHEHELARACRACRAEELAELEADTTPQIATPAPENLRSFLPRRAPRVDDRRDFGQSTELPKPGVSVAHCVCSATFIDSPDGRDAHGVVFGHHPTARPVTEAVAGPGQGAETITERDPWSTA